MLSTYSDCLFLAFHRLTMAHKKHKNRKISRIPSRQVKNQPPGTVIYTGKKTTLNAALDIIDYSQDFFRRVQTKELQDAFEFEETSHVTWINVNGLNDTNTIVALSNHFGLHPLIQEDIVAIHQRPKIEEYDEYLFIVFKMLEYSKEGELSTEHFSLVLGKDYVLTFQEAENEMFSELKDRIEQKRGKIRGAGPDFLAFSILDVAVDNYFAAIEFLMNKIDLLEDKLLDQEEDSQIPIEIQTLKREILQVRRAVLPLREVVNRWEKMESPLVAPKTYKYIRDLYDNVIQVSEYIETHRDLIWGLMDMYLTTLNNKMNEVMKVLTIMASIFIPLTFLTGLYGMNFDNMPELHWKYSYYVILGLMVIIVSFLIWYFRKKKWF